MGSSDGVGAGVGSGLSLGVGDGEPEVSSLNAEVPAPSWFSAVRWAISIVRPVRPRLVMESAAPGSQTDRALYAE